MYSHCSIRLIPLLLLFRFQSTASGLDTQLKTFVEKASGISELRKVGSSSVTFTGHVPRHGLKLSGLLLANQHVASDAENVGQSAAVTAVNLSFSFLPRVSRHLIDYIEHYRQYSCLTHRRFRTD